MATTEIKVIEVPIEVAAKLCPHSIGTYVKMKLVKATDAVPSMKEMLDIYDVLDEGELATALECCLSELCDMVENERVHY